MIQLKVNLNKLKPATINLVADFLQNQQVVVLPTDTISGLSCLADSTAAIKKIYRIKKRDQKKPLLILISYFKMAKKYAAISPTQSKFLKQVWAENQPPTTVILKNLHKLPAQLTGDSDGLAMRLPKSAFLVKIIKKVGVPLVSTSFNLSGQKNIINFNELTKYFPDKKNCPDLVLNAGRAKRRKPSRLFDLREEKNPLLLRK